MKHPNMLTIQDLAVDFDPGGVPPTLKNSRVYKRRRTQNGCRTLIFSF